ncbi:MAG TPA: L,D-transpeptidase family protein [Thermoanaerobaculia bacterium]|nr:L,D-transpeptidase family protein [Thermoanaerobaculia bacterium]
MQPHRGFARPAWEGLAVMALTSALSGLPVAAQTPPPPPAEPAGLIQQIQTVIQAHFPAGDKPAELQVNGSPVRLAAGVPCFYQRRGFAPAWSSEAGADAESSGELLAVIEDSVYDGLRPNDYHPADLKRRLEAVRTHPDPNEFAELDLLLTDVFLNLASDLRYGRVNPRTRAGCEPPGPATKEPPSEPDLPAMLDSALKERRVRSVLEELAPQTEAYKTLRLAVAFYRGIVARGGWPLVPAGPTLHPGDRNPRVAALRERLEASSFVDPAAGGRDLFDAPLQAAVRAFQERNGLEPDGGVGKGTLAALNVPAADRLKQIEVNLERWRWLPRDLGDRYIMVNTAGFLLDVVEEGRGVLGMRVVVGKPYTKSPTFSGKMTYLVIDPYWNVPSSIVTKEIVPHMRRDPGYLTHEGMEVTTSRGGAPVSPASIDWQKTSGAGLVVRQKPGPKNALGRYKFIFPNSFDVYLHDTPSRSLFQRAERSFSHGCIRLEKPLDLALYLLQDEPAWTPESLKAAVAAGKERVVTLHHPIPVHLAYWTVWVDDAGVVQFRKDLYERDKPLLEMLAAE